MDPRARDFALRAAAKVAFAGCFFGCGNTQATPVQNGASTATPTSTPTSTPTASPTSTPTSTPTSNACEPKDVNHPTPTEVACCTDRVHAAAKAGAIQAAPDVACCKALASYNDDQIKAGHGGQETMPERGLCCEALKWSAGITCTPWGPPVPPSISRRARIDARDRALRSRTLDLRRAALALAPSLPSLPHLRHAAIATWRGRMVNEYASATVFDALALQLADAGIDEARVHACATFADEERRHGVLCGAVVEALGERAIADLPEKQVYPQHMDVSRLEAAVRNALSVCCMSETVAVALIGAERFEMPEGPLRDLLTTIWSDEVGHARFGWELLAELAPSFDVAMRARLEAYLCVAFAHLEAHELAHLPAHGGAPPPEGKSLGLCDGASARALFYDTVEGVIVPGLEALGLRATNAWRARSRPRQSSTSRRNRSSASSQRLET